ncbi:transposase [Streptomyces clavifer]|uniref:transposase n=1 Tax=Streptomyces clavifer TaxID=68188 RepID=UPI003805526E
MPTYVETNVWHPACALAAVKAIAVRRGRSRDETVRQLLDEHLEAQEHREPDMRLTHISTVLRYPPALGRRKHRWVPEFGGPLRLRLHPGVADRARTVSLRLPGQFQRAHRDYQSRQLTDAVMTAIAVHEPFTDTYLDGLRPVLRHRAARGLWGLAVAATSTAPELAVHEAVSRAEFPDKDGSATGASAGGPGASSRLLRVAAALEGETGWHSAVRFWVAANIARLLLTGPGRDAAERMLFEQGEQWRELRKRPRPSRLDPYKPYLERRFTEGCTSVTQLHGELVAEQAPVTYGMVRAHIATLRRDPSTAPPRPATVRQVTGWLTRHPATLSAEDRIGLKDLLTRCPELDTAAGHVRDFGEMLTDRLGATLPAWIDAVEASRLPGLTGFALHLRRDLDAVIAGLTLDWSSGSVEGAVNRIKRIKRQLYGRAGFHLLRKMIQLQ